MEDLATGKKALLFPLGQHYDESTLAATKPSFDSTKVHDPGGGDISVAQATSSTTVGEQMLSGRSQNVFRDKVRLKPSNTYQLRSKGPLTV